MDRLELSLSQLYAFTVLAEELHFGRAAARLGIAQPPLSQQLRRLEEKIGHPLFTRAAGGVALTPPGQELLPAARRALAGLAGAVTAARAAGDGRAGRIRIGFAASLALTVLPALLRQFREQSPDVCLHIQEMTTAAQVAALHNRDIDVGLMREPSADTALDFKVVLTEPFVAVLPAGHPLASLRRVPLSHLAGAQFTLLPRHAGPGLYDQIIGLCAEAGFIPDIAQHAVEWQTVCGLVEAGLGVSVAPASTRRIRLRGVAFRPVEPGAARTSVTAAWRKDDRNPLIARLLESVNRDGPAGRSAETT